ncbi:MAG: DUF5684 domain-containing protein [Candidatus Metalachnospira sp.]|nr:DUF5684 domain-containing protein [Candidatus Metalachnospira sp.]
MMRAFNYGCPNIFSFVFGAYATAVSIAGFVFAVLMIIGRWRMYEKAGEPGWAAIIPFYSEYVLFKIGWGTGWLFLIMLIPIVNIVFGIMLAFKLARAYGMGSGFAIGIIFLPSIFFLILGFSDAKYYGPVEN